MLDNSPSPSVELSSSAFKFSTQISMTDVDSMLEALNAQEQASTSPAQLHSDVHKDAVFGQVREKVIGKGCQVKSSQVKIFFNDGSLNKHFTSFFFFYIKPSEQ